MTLVLSRRKALITLTSLIAAPALVRVESLMKIRGVPLDFYPTPMLQHDFRERFYKLVGREVMAVPGGVIEWAQAMRGENPVAYDEIDGVSVSTIFLGLDHGFGFSKKPVLFETMVFGGTLNEERRRYTSYADAEKGHAEMLTKATSARKRVPDLPANAISNKKTES